MKSIKKDATEKLNLWLQILEEGIQWLANLNAISDVTLTGSDGKSYLRYLGRLLAPLVFNLLREDYCYQG